MSTEPTCTACVHTHPGIVIARFFTHYKGRMVGAVSVIERPQSDGTVLYFILATPDIHAEEWVTEDGWMSRQGALIAAQNLAETHSTR